MVVLGVLVPLVGAAGLRAVLRDWRWEAARWHEVVEVCGGFIAFSLAAVLLELRRHRPRHAHFVWIAAALSAVGALDIVHAGAGGHELWFESWATVLGGVLFSAVWLPSTWAPRAPVVIPAVGAAALAIGLAPMLAPELVPQMARGGFFTGLAHALNAVGAVAFLAAAIRFLQRYRVWRGWDDYLFAVLCALFGTSAFAFDDAMPWTANWWWWHALHVGAYGALLVFSFRIYVGAHARLRQEMGERAQLEEQLRHSQKMEAVGTLASGIAHDFNNLLMGVAGCADVARAHLEDPEMVRAQLAVIKQEVGKGSALTKQLLAFGRARELAPVSLHVDSVVAETEALLRNILGEDIAFDVTLSGTNAYVLGDRGQLQQVLLNLAINARDAMPAGGKLAIAVEHVAGDDADRAATADVGGDGSYARIRVSDTGCGMPEDVRSRAFEPFYTTKEIGRGTGLGLAMVYGIVKRCGGAVDVRSEVGRGTLFELLLPCVEPGPQVDLEGSAPQDLAGSETVLVIEDEPAVRRSIEHYLQRWGYTPIAVRDGREALAAASDPLARIDVLLTDVVLPGMSGPEVARVLRVRRPELPVLFMSAYPQDKLVRDGRIPAETQTLHKPFSEGQLLSQVRRALTDRTEQRAPAREPERATTVLLVEDHATARLAVAELLRDDGYRVLEADSGREALELLEANGGSIDVVLTDVRLPDVSGPKLVDRVLERTAAGIVYMSGLSPDDPAVRDAVAATGALFIQKPAELDDIADKVGRAAAAPCAATSRAMAH